MHEIENVLALIKMSKNTDSSKYQKNIWTCIYKFRIPFRASPIVERARNFNYKIEISKDY